MYSSFVLHVLGTYILFWNSSVENLFQSYIEKNDMMHKPNITCNLSGVVHGGSVLERRGAPRYTILWLL